MSKEFEKTKETKKSKFYENDDYRIQLKEGGFVIKKNDMFKPWYDEEKEEGEFFSAYMEEMIVTNKHTKKKSRKRVYQGNPLKDFEDDLEKKSQFKDIFNKIDD